MDELSRMKEFYEASNTTGSDPFMVLPYCPNFSCPKCKSSIWLNPTIFQTPAGSRLWLGKTTCYKCKEESAWIMNPDFTIENQSPLMHRPLGYDKDGNANGNPLICDKKLMESMDNETLDQIIWSNNPPETYGKKYQDELDKFIEKLKRDAESRRNGTDPEDDEDEDNDPMR